MPAKPAVSVQELARIVQPPAPPAPDSSPITVHAAVSRFAVLYEKIRNAVDYKDDHLLRKSAIVRIMKRQLALEGDATGVATQLIRELIAARYLPNGMLPESLIDQAALVIQKYLAVRRIDVGDEDHDEWLLGITAAELEELVDDHTQVKGFINFLYAKLADTITVSDSSLTDTDRRLQVYIACYRSLVKADDEMIGYKLARAYEPSWMTPETWVNEPQAMAVQMVQVHACSKAALHHPLAMKFQAAVKPWSISLSILRTALNEQPSAAETLLQDKELLHKTIERIADRRLKESRSKLRRGIIRAIIYLFITKILIALAIEVPVEGLLYGAVHRTSLLINILFPPVLMFLVGALIRMPGKDNIKRIKQGVDELLSESGPPEKRIRVARARGSFGRFVFGLAYAFAFIISFGIVALVLNVLHFTWVSALIFMFFLCVVSFFAFRLRLSAREFVAVERPDRIHTMLLDFFSIPILRAGRWFSESVSRINVFIFIFDFIIEAPFKIFLNVLEEWSAFMKEKKEQLQ